MIEVRQTPEFRDWHAALKDRRAAAKITVRLARVEFGNLGDVKPVGDGVSELRINYGPGYRLYIVRRGATLVVALCGGDKSSQDRDIKQARALVTDWEQEDAS